MRYLEALVRYLMERSGHVIPVPDATLDAVSKRLADVQEILVRN